MVRKSAHTTLAEDHVVIALREDILGGHQELIQRGRHPAFQEDRLFRPPHALEQREILHVTRAHLQHIGILLNQIAIHRIDSFGHNQQPEVLADFAENLQPLFAQPLKAVRRGTWLDDATAKQPCSSALNTPCGAKSLVAALDGARPGDDRKLLPSYHKALVPYADQRIFIPNLAAYQFVGLGNANRLRHTRHAFKQLRVEGPGIPGNANGRALRPWHWVSAKAHRLDFFADSANLFFARRRLHHN